MPILTTTITVPDPDQPLAELTRAEWQQAFTALATVTSRLESRRRSLYRLLQAVDQRATARRILSNLTPEQIEALRVELERTP